MAPLVFNCAEFNEPPPGLEQLRERLAQRCGHAIASRHQEWSEGALRYAQLHRQNHSERPNAGELWLEELPEAKIEVRVGRRCDTPPHALFFEKLGWTVPGTAPPYWQVTVSGDLTLQAALADVLRECGGCIDDHDGSAFSGPIDIAVLRQRLAKGRRYGWIGLIAVVAYGLLVVILMPIWLPVILIDAARGSPRFFSRLQWLQRSKINARHAAEGANFARYLLRRIGRCGGKIGTAGRLFGSKVRCRIPAATWAARQQMGPWGRAETILVGLCHTDSGSPWYIQFADRPPEPLADWLDRAMRSPSGR